MSLYYEAAAIINNEAKVGGSLKSRIFGKKDLKSKPAQVFALVIEASKWSIVLKDVIERSGVLEDEKKLTPLLALLLTHDLLLSKSGVAANSNHVLKLSINRHKARLSAEFTKARIRGGFSSVEAFREAINEGNYGESDNSSERTLAHPRWIRVNTLKTTLEEQLATTFAGYTKTEHLKAVLTATGSSKILHIDPNIPSLLALPSKADFAKSLAYTSGKIIFQDKASCFPAYLLNIKPENGTIIDACAAPGNKTTHVAAFSYANAQQHGSDARVIAFERDRKRAMALKKMVNLAGADNIVSIRGGQDFLSTNPSSEEFSQVGALVLDPSCSGSGIVGRDDSLTIHLPSPSSRATPGSRDTTSKNSKKRKRTGNVATENKSTSTAAGENTISLPSSTDAQETEEQEEEPTDSKKDRLQSLSTFQLHILTHAMRFRSATKITYSTCSIHFTENEGVVFRALASDVARKRGWRIMRRKEQVRGMKSWERRGVASGEEMEAVIGREGENEKGKWKGTEEEKKEVLDACIRCQQGTEEGTMGFFVAGFVRDGDKDGEGGYGEEVEAIEEDKEVEEWNGFDDDEVEVESNVVEAPPSNKVIKRDEDIPQAGKKKKRRKNSHL
ncbi:S-adenosyl-L-methionine-dependent methyltransferase [Delitschia confertaspora ATCC 74209]|uniref:S-adenosyl-L-methionine-dependent methyltransferase n=1 Tax=Delitschia confertaspora ATCC 74209 TaxID=1513339 RepID=A0A9P4JSA4_9PLEO|nr:S-adenosyl-L-methionine-dependent methyltransferase [Delitschia confertaspora ATCC 74209]